MDISYDSYICKDDDGNVFISLESISEVILSENQLLTHCLAVVKIGNDYLLGWNKWRNRYEIFGGCIESGETARECIIRECYEELGIHDVNIVYIGAMKYLMQPDYFSSNERIEYGGLYGITLSNVSIEDIYSQIKDKDEIKKLALYSQIKNSEPIALIDEKLLDYFL
ncbi:MAG: NUDIX domain-containing protein [Ruminococcus sp.]|nr:NUDIX domain-containing protein [Ruminococcus sp.]